MKRDIANLVDTITKEEATLDLIKEILANKNRILTTEEHTALCKKEEELCRVIRQNNNGYDVAFDKDLDILCKAVRRLVDKKSKLWKLYIEQVHANLELEKLLIIQKSKKK